MQGCTSEMKTDQVKQIEGCKLWGCKCRKDGQPKKKKLS